ncbi:aromatic ring-hydroxylating oxygenase subunit alpha [Sciscionella marina]|uniref:aromatic ring-hydroxylating oxygenase subunit alpha n=1 Tax=Sciscionella marina TaxID=508770 RepID=UPI00036A69B8|nr:aromatic ring-hydroxylating dioxygenase subunit alpha [Sciscionella marina]
MTTLVDTRIAELIARRKKGHSLPAEFYTSPEIFHADIEAIFARHWLLATTEAEIPEPGDFVTVEIGPYSVIVLRDDDEQVRAMHNVCRHRGARILTESSGSVGNIVCGYHKWTYRTDGSLLHAVSPPPGFDPGCFGLKPVAVQVAGGFVFCCLAEHPPEDFAEVAAIIERYAAPHRLDRATVIEQIDLVERGNWKLVMENNRECYHCDGHPELSCSLFPTYGYTDEEVPATLRAAFDRYVAADTALRDTCDSLGLAHRLIEQLSGRVSGFRVQREPMDGAGESFSSDGRVICTKLLGDIGEPRLGRFSLHLQPNVWLHVCSDHAVTFSAVPLSAGETLVRTTWLVHEDAVEGRDFDRQQLTEVWRRTNEQDAGFVERAQLGVRSPAYVPGPYTTSEYQVDQFCDWYLDRLGAHA